VSPVPDEPEDVPPRAVPRTRARERERDNIDDVVARSNEAVSKRSTASPRAERTKQTELTALDRVLDKISAQGLESLTSDERRLLSEESKRRRTE
jgi:hypothetical protein